MKLTPRQAFERWARGHGYPTWEWRDGQYTDPTVQAVWRGWLATRNRRSR